MVFQADSEYAVVIRQSLIVATPEIFQPILEPSINHLILLDMFSTSQYIDSSFWQKALAVGEDPEPT